METQLLNIDIMCIGVLIFFKYVNKVMNKVQLFQHNSRNCGHKIKIEHK